MNFKSRLEDSLKNDYAHWTLVQKGTRGEDWIEYWSPHYSDVLFMVDHQCYVFKDGEVVDEFPIWPFTRCARLVSRMKKYTLEKTGCFRSELMPT